MKKPIKKWQGLNPRRYKDNPMERKLALAWEKINKFPGDSPTNLDHLLDPTSNGHIRATTQERVATNTVICLCWFFTQVSADDERFKAAFETSMS